MKFIALFLFSLTALTAAANWFTAEGETWDGDKWIPATCEVTLTYADGDTVNVTNNGNCATFCGARANLEIKGAKRK